MQDDIMRLECPECEADFPILRSEFRDNMETECPDCLHRAPAQTFLEAPKP